MTKVRGWPETGFGRRLREVREARGLSQQELARQTGCHLMTVSKLERGLQEPAWPLVLALGRALGVSCEEFATAARGKRPAGGRAAKPKKRKR